MKRYIVFIFAFCVTTFAFAEEKVSFAYKNFVVGKALLAEKGFVIQKNLGVANFSPELKLPIELVYESRNEKSGLYGYAIRCPQLESRAYYDKEKVVWKCPWGEEINFFAKNDKTPKDSLKLDVIENAKKGKGYFAPYQNWEAIPLGNEKLIATSGDFEILGKRDFRDWRFIYRESRLQEIKAPSGRRISFIYEKKKLIKIIQENVAFVEMSYQGNLVSSLKINGVETCFNYREEDIVIKPKAEEGKIFQARALRLVRYQLATLNPIEFLYRDNYMSSVVQGEANEEFEVDNKTGRIIMDGDFLYSYEKAGEIKLTNAKKETAIFDYDGKRGILKIRDFSGKELTISYFMRLDVAYSGKIQEIKDSRDRILLQNYFDRRSGNLIRKTDRFGNDIDFEYDKDGNLAKIFRRAAKQNSREPVLAINHDSSGLPIEISQLDENESSVVKTQISYNKYRDKIGFSDGQKRTQISYTQFGYPKAIKDTFSQTKLLQYDKYNRIISQLDQFGVITSFSYNDFGVVNKIERRENNVIINTQEIAYNKNGCSIATRNHKNDVKYFPRNSKGQIVKERFEDGSIVQYEYDVLGNLAKVIDENKNEIKFNWSKFGLSRKTTAIGQITDYIYFGRVIEKQDGAIVSKYIYNSYGQRTLRVTKTKNKTLKEIKKYDSYGRLSEIISDGKKVRYRYNLKNQLIEQNIDGVAIEYEYTKHGQLLGKYLGGKENPIASLTYQYEADGNLLGRTINGVKQKFICDKKGQFLLALNDKGEVLEKYTYDPAGNILEKIVNGEKTTFTYDDANQLVSSFSNEKVINFKYDAAGRMIQEGNKRYKYGYWDKIISISENDSEIATFDYQCDGQIESANYLNTSKKYLWDGLVLIARDDETLINDPHATGGNPILSSRQGILFNDALGTTIGIKCATEDYRNVDITSFGETENGNVFFTGKPNIDGLGYKFLFRNYRNRLGKWQTADPIGYPDGWNNLAYCGNKVLRYTDKLGLAVGDIYTTIDAAAIAWGYEFNCRSIRENKEYGSSIYKNNNGYSYTAPNIGDESSVSPSVPQNGESIVADIHSHAAYDPRYGDSNDEFSTEDKTGNDTRLIIGCLATPIGYLKRYNPIGYNGLIGGTTYILSRFLCYDFRHPKRRIIE